MAAIDGVNATNGHGAVTSAAAGIKQEWQTMFEMQLSRYATRVDKLPAVRAR